jgi:hypothetical protein
MKGASLQLAPGSNQHPRIAYTVQADNSLRLAWSTAPATDWQVETVATFAGDPRPDVASRALERDHNAFSYPAGGIGYAFRAASLPYYLYYNPLQPCVEDLPEPTGYGRALRDLFALSPGGQHYIRLYYQFAFQTGSLAVANPALAWDAYRTLQNFMPGFQALVAGQGNQIVITQAMVDQGNDIADRLAAADSPSLGDAITLERAKYNHLQVFVGKTFVQAAGLLGVANNSVFLPLVRR